MRNLRQYIEGWISAFRASAELDRLDRSEVNRLAAEAGVSVPELRTFGAGWPNAAALLERRLAQIHLTAAAHAEPAVFRDMQRVCAHCAAKNRCEHDLDLHPSDPDWIRYCPNAGTLEALR